MRRALLALLLVAGGAACSDEPAKTTAPPAPAPDLPGGATPAEAYTKLRAALHADAANDPWQRVALLFPHVTVASRVRLLGSLYHEAAFSSMTGFEPDPKKLKVLEGIYARHGVSTASLEGVPPAEQVRRRFGAVEDKAGLMEELLGFLERYGERVAPKKGQDGEAAPREAWGDGLEELKRDGERATALAEVRKGSAARRQPLTFVREAGRWRVEW